MAKTNHTTIGRITTAPFYSHRCLQPIGVDYQKKKKRGRKDGNTLRKLLLQYAAGAKLGTEGGKFYNNIIIIRKLRKVPEFRKLGYAYVVFNFFLGIIAENSLDISDTGTHLPYLWF